METRTEKYKNEFRKIVMEENKNRTKKILSIIIPIIIIVFIWGKFISVNILKTNYFSITNENIPSSFENYKIVQFSDFHFNKFNNKNKLEKVVKKINSYEPDIIVFNGDLIDEKYTANENDYKVITKELKKLKKDALKYSVFGDEDFYNDNYDNIMYDSGFELLKNNYDIVYKNDNNPILIYGLDTTLKGNPNIDLINKKNIKNIAYKIILVHEPDYANEIPEGTSDMILAAHSMYGQVKLPIIKPLHLPKGAKEYYNKENKVNGTKLYISGGCGQKKYNFRLFTLPSINAYELKTK